jgi:hypothetical protein
LDEPHRRAAAATAPQREEGLVVCENLVRIYRTEGVEVRARQGLDLTVAQGELIALIGASGSGTVAFEPGASRSWGRRQLPRRSRVLHVEVCARSRWCCRVGSYLSCHRTRGGNDGNMARRSPELESGSSAGQGVDMVSVSLPQEDDAAAEILVFRDEADSYARLRRYRVYVDGKRVGDLRRGENCVISVAPGSHTVQVRISWCTSPVSSVQVSPGDRSRFICRARPGVESDPTAVFRLRHDFLVLRAA